MGTRHAAVLVGALLVALASRARAQDADADHDGVPDATDLCLSDPETPNGIDDGDGCPDADADHDGVPDDRDVCPGVAEQANGFQDDDGCPDDVAAQLYTLAQRVLFPVGRDGLTGAALRVVRDVATYVVAHPELTLVNVEGYADARGGADANRALSERRAANVRTLLVGAGVNPTRIASIGRGPLPGTSPLVRAQNRRVTFSIGAWRSGEGRNVADISPWRGDWTVAGALTASVGARPTDSVLRPLAGAPAWLGSAGSQLTCYAAKLASGRLWLMCRGVEGEVRVALARVGGGARAYLAAGRGAEEQRRLGAPSLACVAPAVLSNGSCVVPAVPATLASACTIDSFHGHTYAFCSSTPRPYPDAVAWCASFPGFHLAVPRDADEDAFILARVGGGMWVGATDIAQEGTFTELDGTPISYTHWCPGEPNDDGGAEDCALAVQQASYCGNGGACVCWNDGTCDSALPYICEGDSTAPPAPPCAAPRVTQLRLGASDGWTTEHVPVSAGAVVQVAASGAVHACWQSDCGATCYTRWVSAAGTACPSSSSWPAPELPLMGLVGAYGGRRFLVGEGTTFTTDLDGSLDLSVNDDNMSDNAGDLVVTVSICDRATARR